jgi:carbonic anhydrase
VSADLPDSPLDLLLAANRTAAESHHRLERAAPARHVAVVTCMDARIDPLEALGLALGEAHVIRNAGGRVTDDVLRSLALSTHVLEVEAVVVMQHTRCGLAGATNEALSARTGAEIDFLPIADHAAALDADLRALRECRWLGTIKVTAGWVYDVDTGKVAELLRWSADAP